MSISAKRVRIIEAFTGLLLILGIASIIISFLLNFDYTIPHSSLEDDVDFILDSINRQKVSATSWIFSGVLLLITLPLYLFVFFPYQKGMHIISSLVLLTAAYSFFRTGTIAFSIAELVSQSISENEVNALPPETLLPYIKEILILIKIGISSYGAFAMIFSISKFENTKFPVIGSSLVFFSGPLIIAFTWLNHEHIIMTTALSLLCIGLFIIGTMLITRGMEK